MPDAAAAAAVAVAVASDDTTDPFVALAPALVNIQIREHGEQQEQQEQEQEQEQEQQEQQEQQEFIEADIIQNIQNKLIINKIEQKLFKLKQCYFNPQTLTIQGYNLLNHTPQDHWKSRLYTLFSDACLPHYYIIDCWKNPSENMTDDFPNVIHIQLITYLAKMFVKETLIHFLSYNNFNINVID